jgi:hypothetical protein
VLWKARNDKVFNDLNFKVEAIVEEVKVLAWKWAMNRMNIPVCLFFEWCWNPQWCLSRCHSRVWVRDQLGCFCFCCYSGLVCVAAAASVLRASFGVCRFFCLYSML